MTQWAMFWLCLSSILCLTMDLNDANSGRVESLDANVIYTNDYVYHHSMTGNTVHLERCSLNTALASQKITADQRIDIIFPQNQAINTEPGNIVYFNDFHMMVMAQFESTKLKFRKFTEKMIQFDRSNVFTVLMNETREGDLTLTLSEGLVLVKAHFTVIPVGSDDFNLFVCVENDLGKLYCRIAVSNSSNVAAPFNISDWVEVTNFTKFSVRQFNENFAVLVDAARLVYFDIASAFLPAFAPISMNIPTHDWMGVEGKELVTVQNNQPQAGSKLVTTYTTDGKALAPQNTTTLAKGTAWHYSAAKLFVADEMRVKGLFLTAKWTFDDFLLASTDKDAAELLRVDYTGTTLYLTYASEVYVFRVFEKVRKLSGFEKVFGCGLQAETLQCLKDSLQETFSCADASCKTLKDGAATRDITRFIYNYDYPAQWARLLRNVREKECTLCGFHFCLLTAHGKVLSEPNAGSRCYLPFEQAAPAKATVGKGNQTITATLAGMQPACSMAGLRFTLNEGQSAEIGYVSMALFAGMKVAALNDSKVLVEEAQNPRVVVSDGLSFYATTATKVRLCLSQCHSYHFGKGHYPIKLALVSSSGRITPQKDPKVVEPFEGFPKDSACYEMKFTSKSKNVAVLVREQAGAFAENKEEPNDNHWLYIGIVCAVLLVIAIAMVIAMLIWKVVKWRKLKKGR